MRKHLLIACVLMLAASTALGAGFVKLRYSIWNSEGKLLESTPQGLAVVMALERMTPAWRAAIDGMAAGDRKRFDADQYEVEAEVLELIDGPDAPADLTAPPADALKTRSGLAHKLLREGTGSRKPGRRNTVQVNYSGWTTDGRIFDSTILRGSPAEFRLGNVIAGWTEGLQLMTEGEVRRFWIPAKLAYAGSPDMPQGLLVFDIELLAIK